MNEKISNCISRMLFEGEKKLLRAREKSREKNDEKRGV
jgi:hypothetical protein